ncbi:MAG: diacylglycerol kinase family protein [Patescibacteria group bacterium]|nr:diacylglycerol kinase family protein [Patescibacteria group bacterium]
MIRYHKISFKHALDGLFWAFKTQPNFRIHLSLSILSLVTGFLFKVSYFEFLLILFLITVGLVVETINTSLEQTTDAIDQKIRDDIRIAKDVAAGAMLIYAVGASIIALIIFIPKILKLIGYFG